MQENLITGLAGIVLLGIGSQWLAWRLRIPAIIPLLIAGFVAGPLTGWFRPQEFFGDLMLPIVSISVGLVLFEGGLGLKREELKGIAPALGRMITVGAGITWLGTAAAARIFIGLPVSISLLLGAILVVTGPTVVLPMLRQVRPKGASGALLKWEGILSDPLGASLALLVFEGILIGESSAATKETALAIVRTVGVAGITGIGGAFILTELLRRYWIPDYLQNSVTIMFAIGGFALSDYWQHESGLLALTLMGIYLANQRKAEVHHIIEFKENVRVLLISGLFIVLAASVDREALLNLPPSSFVFLAILILVIRPFAVFVATAGADLSWQEKTFTSWMAPRGIVAASVSSVFGLRLSEAGVEGAELLTPITFLVIAGTVAVYGLTARPVARALSITQPNPSGLLFVGAHRWSRVVGSALKKEGVSVTVADTNYALVSAARLEGLKAYHGNALSDHATEEMDLSGVGRLIAVTPNDAVNSFASIHFGDAFGRGKVFQLASTHDELRGRIPVAQHLRGRDLFAEGMTYDRLSDAFKSGGEIHRAELTDDYELDDLKKEYGARVLPLFVIDGDTARPVTTQDPPKAGRGAVVISLLTPEGTTILDTESTEESND